jgi:hypothetical protein
MLKLKDYNWFLPMPHLLNIRDKIWNKTYTKTYEICFCLIFMIQTWVFPNGITQANLQSRDRPSCYIPTVQNNLFHLFPLPWVAWKGL